MLWRLLHTIAATTAVGGARGGAERVIDGEGWREGIVIVVGGFVRRTGG